MSVEEITTEETAKIAGILEAKWTQTDADKTRFKAEAELLRTALDIMTGDRDYWRGRAEAGERERDEARASEEYMLQQWLKINAIAAETKIHVLGGRNQPIVTDEETKLIGAKFGADSRTN